MRHRKSLAHLDTLAPPSLLPLPFPLPLPGLIPPPHNVSPAVTTPQVLRPNIDIGHSLQELLGSDDDSKFYTPPSVQNPDSPEQWQCQVLRFYFQNVNGLRFGDNGSDILDAFFHMESIRADVFGFVETKLDCRQSFVQQLLHRQKQKVWDHCKLVTASSSCPWHSPHKPGGTLLAVTGPLIGRARHTISDDLG